MRAPRARGLVYAGVKVQQDEWFAATVKAVMSGGFYFLSWDDGYSADRTKCFLELRHRRCVVVVVAEGEGEGEGGQEVESKESVPGGVCRAK